MKKQFESADVDGSRAIDCDELKELMAKMSVNIPPQYVIPCFKRI